MVEREEEGVTVKDRLLSIEHDAAFVDTLKNQFPSFPVIPNERCGSWYVRPSYYIDNGIHPVYFKSTDGHEGEWSFSTRRLNMHLLNVLARYGGALLVDSSRRGKIPDSFSKTVPIWAAIINETLHGAGDWLNTPREVVFLEEENCIREKLSTFRAAFESVRECIPGGVPLCAPVRVFWVYPGSEIPVFNGDESFAPLILVTASDPELTVEGFTYVPGAGDDHEMWAGDLTVEKFWARGDVVTSNKIAVDVHHVNDTLSFGRIIGDVITNAESVACDDSLTGFDCIVILDAGFVCEPLSERIVQIKAVSGTKPGARMLRRSIDGILKSVPLKGRTLVLCGRGDDLAVGLVLCLLNHGRSEVTKTSIRRDFVSLTKFGELNPQRATLNAVHDHLLKRIS
ncbi:hypothetical protein CANINC_001842 [Pichia inconspicua]|uniref:Initiator tRNA phosphoribosyl transferase n=1 Tax=Pichia inconspicua TaxID=52247 RepID=A0A4T0X2P2_9ASCO|nr:hypothetical protein CANINC_001842 [[Candida] inconspicua]